VCWWLFERVILTWVFGDLLLKRSALSIDSIGGLEVVEDGQARFSLGCISKSRFSDAVVSYELWSKADPKVSIVVKERVLCYDKVQGGVQREYLPLQLPEKGIFSKSGEWVVRVRVISTKHTFNPFHKIYPCVSEKTQLLRVSHEK
jgi:hypothetical protein